MEKTDIQHLQSENENLLQELQELREANKELLVCKQQLDAIMDNAPVEIYLKDRAGRYLRINKQFEKIFGVKGEDLVGLMPADVVDDPELSESTRKHDMFVLESGVAEHREEFARLTSDNQLHTLLTIKFPVFDDNGEVDGLGAVVTDISEIKQLEESLRRAQRMDAIGQLSGGIAHDFNNLLGIIMGNLELLELMLKHDPKALQHVESALKGAARGAELTRKLVSFSRPTGGSARTVCLNEFIQGMESMTAKSLTVSIKLEMQLRDELWLVKIDAGEMEDAILNLSLNARDALPSGGRITITTSNEVIDKDYVRRHPQAHVGDFVMLSVRDNGHGMTEDVLKRATEPFFTMKQANEGTGLGLSMVYGFVKRSGGHMQILSGPGTGTEVRLYLPRVDSELDSTAQPTPPVSIREGNESVLIVDDEQSLIDIAVSYFQSLGYTTYTASNSEQAVALIQTHMDIDLLFADIIMPGERDGLELALLVRQLRPNLKILLTSGFNRSHHEAYACSGRCDSLSDFKKGLLAGVLQKPYGKSELSVAVRRVLDEEDRQARENHS